MTFYDPSTCKFEPAQHPRLRKLMTCPGCLKEYELGISGTVNGCDECEHIIRLLNGTIDMSAYTETFIVETTGEEISIHVN